MAGNKTEEMNVSSCTTSDIFKCNICYDKFTKPRMLPCLHSFCEPCLQTHVNYSTNVNPEGVLVFSCPTCRERVNLPEDGVAGFRHDFRVTQFQDILENSQVSTEVDSLTCQFCQSEDKTPGPSHYFCKDCCKFLCVSCTVKHREKAIFQGHQLLDRRQNTMISIGETCRTHRNEQVQYVCLSCHASICSLCVMTSFHDDHNVLDMTKGLQHYVDNFTQLFKDLSERSCVLQQKLTVLAQNEESARIHRTLAARKIKDRVDSLIEHIQRQERRLLNELDKRCTAEMDSILEHQQELEISVSEIRNVADLCSSFAQKPPLCSMVPIYGDLCERIEKLLKNSSAQETDVEIVASPRSSVEFAPGSSRPKIGRLYSRLPKSKSSNHSKSKHIPVCERISANGIVSTTEYSSGLPRAHLKAKLGRTGTNGGEFNSPRDVAFLPNGSFVVADTNNNRLQLFSANGLLVNVIGEGQIKPWGVCVTQDGLLALTDNLDKCVKIYRPNGVLISRIGKLLCPCGIAVNRKGQLIVTDFFSTYGYVLDRAGTLVKQFEVRSNTDQHTCGASRIAVDSQGHIVISDISNACVKVFDKDGKLLNVIPSSDNLVAPQGVCFDSNDLLLVADALKQAVLTFDPEGSYLGKVIEGKHRLKDATGLAVSEEGHMAVTQLKSNQLKLYNLSYNQNQCD